MSKRPPSQLSKCPNEYDSTELDPKMLNIAAGGHFYERAKSRRQRHREVFATGAGREVTNAAVPLGYKRKNSGSVKDALAKLSAKKGGNVGVGASSVASESVSKRIRAETNARSKQQNTSTTEDASAKESIIGSQQNHDGKCDNKPSDDNVIDLTGE